MHRFAKRSLEVCVKIVSRHVVFLVSFLLSCLLLANAQQTANTVDPKTYDGLKWRLIGPFRGGRAITVTGVPSQQNTFYFGAVGGGVWKTTSSRHTLHPPLQN